ncbi:hypothetical protein MTO96_022196 [Rhipicephalus appendiculatus]
MSPDPENLKVVRESGGSVEPPSTPTELSSPDGETRSKAVVSRRPSYPEGRRGGNRSAQHSTESSITVEKEQEDVEYSSSDRVTGYDYPRYEAGSGGKPVSPESRSHKTVGYMRHAALVLLSLMVCVALAVFLAYNMTFGRDEATPTTRVDTGSEVYPPLVVPGPHYATEKPTKFVIWVLGLLTKVPEMAPTRDTEATTKPVEETTSTTSVEETTSASTADIEQVTKSSTVEGVFNTTLADESSDLRNVTEVYAGSSNDI